MQAPMTATVSPSQLFPVLEALGFDLASGVEQCGSDEAFYCDLIGELHSDVLVRRNAELATTDLQKRREFAHLLKGTLQVLGERRASPRARELEQVLRNGQPSQELTDGLLQELDRLDAALGKLFS